MTVTVLPGPDRRRRWTFAEKLRMVGECLAPEAIVAEVARRHDIHPNHFMHGGAKHACAS
jgi:transposase